MKLINEKTYYTCCKCNKEISYINPYQSLKNYVSIARAYGMSRIVIDETYKNKITECLRDDDGNEYCEDCINCCELCNETYFCYEENEEMYCYHIIGPCCSENCKCGKPYCESCNVITCNCYHDELNKYILKELANIIIEYISPSGEMHSLAPQARREYTFEKMN